MILAPVFTASCASLKSVSLTQIPADRSRPIAVTTSSLGILGLYANNDFADEAIEELREKCPDGKVTGVYTKYDGRNYFLWGIRTITAKAYCQAKKES
jgi:hypothetical protein